MDEEFQKRLQESRVRTAALNTMPLDQIPVTRANIVARPKMVDQREVEHIILTTANIEQLRNGDVLCIEMDEIGNLLYITVSE